jgi:two-component system, chemotaxis family, CheB/CheR fusion protein
MMKKTKSNPNSSPKAESLSHADNNGNYEKTLNGNFPIVGVGASAGGLEALEQFLKHMPDDSGIAIIILQHLDPHHKSMMVELLQRVTSLKVRQAADQMTVRPNQVYVTPPNCSISIHQGVISLHESDRLKAINLPIDFFFRSLAEDKKEHSIGIILSGMGSDGTLGLRAVKECNGIVMVQDPATAKFDSMPRSVINSGLADFIASPDELPKLMISYFKSRPPAANKLKTPSDDRSYSSLNKLIVLLRSHTGHDFSQYKKNTLYRRIERRMGIHQISKISDYVQFLHNNPMEIEILFKEFLIGVTNFFRDAPAWDFIKEQVMPELFRNRPANHIFRAWLPGCSTGEEAYSLAIIFKEALDSYKSKDKRFSLQIFGTDLDKDAIDRGRQGFFPSNIEADISPERLRRFFNKEESNYRVTKEIRDMIIFAPQNIIMDPPFTKLDLLICRNLLIYFETDLQKNLFPLFHYTLNTGGILFLGIAESIGSFSDKFSALHPKYKIYKRTESLLPKEPVDFPRTFFAARKKVTGNSHVQKSEVNLQTLADQLIQQKYSPASVLVNNKGDILYINGRTGKYLEPVAGKANWNIFAMAREELRYEMMRTFQNVLISKEGKAKSTNIKISTVDTESLYIDLTMELLSKPEPLDGMVIIVFTEMGWHSEKQADGKNKTMGANKRIAELEQELLRVRSELQTSREVMDSSQEELKSINEELQATNEEAQSSNEELTTSKEEMQALNEELHTVNVELQSKLEDLSRANNDMKNLLNSTDIATIFIDQNFRIRRYTIQATKIIKLIPTDLGRPLSDMVIDLIYPELPADAQEVMRTLLTIEKKITTNDNRWFLVRIMPYRTIDNVIDGVVITFTEITASIGRESELVQIIDNLKKNLSEKDALSKKLANARNDNSLTED